MLFPCPESSSDPRTDQMFGEAQARPGTFSVEPVVFGVTLQESTSPPLSFPFLCVGPPAPGPTPSHQTPPRLPLPTRWENVICFFPGRSVNCCFCLLGLGVLFYADSWSSLSQIPRSCKHGLCRRCPRPPMGALWMPSACRLGCGLHGPHPHWLGVPAPPLTRLQPEGPWASPWSSRPWFSHL